MARTIDALSGQVDEYLALKAEKGGLEAEREVLVAQLKANGAAIAALDTKMDPLKAAITRFYRRRGSEFFAGRTKVIKLPTGQVASRATTKVVFGSKKNQRRAVLRLLRLPPWYLRFVRIEFQRKRLTVHPGVAEKIGLKVVTEDVVMISRAEPKQS